MANALKKNIAFGDIFKKHSTSVYWVILFVLIVLEILVVKDSVNIILSSKPQIQELPSAKGGRIDFAAYDKAVARIESGKVYEPIVNNLDSPFTVAKSKP